MGTAALRVLGSGSTSGLPAPQPSAHAGLAESGEGPGSAKAPKPADAERPTLESCEQVPGPCRSVIASILCFRVVTSVVVESPNASVPRLEEAR